MLAKLLSLWVTGSLVVIALCIILIFAGEPPFWGNNWFETILVGLSPVGALCGWLLIWIISIVLPGVTASGVTKRVTSVSDRWTGRRYEATGQYAGKVTEDGRRYDATGQYAGKVTEDGRRYEATGQYEGKVTEDGRRYDATGQYEGKTNKD